MGHLILASISAIRSLLMREMFALLMWCLMITFCVLVAFVSGVTELMMWISQGMHSIEGAAALPWIGAFAASLFAWILFPGIMPIIVNFFDHQIATIIEQRDYPATVIPNPTEDWQTFFHDLRFSLMTIGVNIVVLPLYLLLPGINVLLFYGLNGYLLGREFFTMVARRHMPLLLAEKLRREHSAAITSAGVALVFLATIPILNVFAPFWGIALMVHLYHRLVKTPFSDLLPPVK